MTIKNNSFAAKVGKTALSLTLAAAFAPAVALADVQEAVAATASSFTGSAVLHSNISGEVNDYADPSGSTESVGSGTLSPLALSLPSKYDLRDVNGKNYVTPVKDQSPFGTCWAFAATAASETSLLTSLGVSYEEAAASDDLFTRYVSDLSERHLAWFAYGHPDNLTPSQKGEGQYLVDSIKTGYDADYFDTGGSSYLAMSIYTSGAGPMPEEYAPYQTEEGDYEYTGTWGLPEDDHYSVLAELDQSNVLPSAANANAVGMKAIKDEIIDGHAVSIAFCADTAMPGQTEQEEYINTKTFAHYTYDPNARANHAVTIVGWDDNYSASNFKSGTAEVEDDGDVVTVSMTPPGDGAWIVKNSWGSLNSTGHDKYNWGTNGSGYFYLSYYDLSLRSAESFEYDIVNTGDYLTYQYDYALDSDLETIASAKKLAACNVFKADYAKKIRQVGCITGKANDKVTLQIYVCKKNANVKKVLANNKPSKTISKTFEYAGFHRIDIKGLKVKKNQKLIIVQTTKQSAGKGKYEVCFTESLAKNGAEAFESTTYSKAIVNSGESFVYDGGVWTDWKSIVKSRIASYKRSYGISNLVAIDNFGIRAYADEL